VIVQMQTLFDIVDKPFEWWILLPPTGLVLLGLSLTWMEGRKIGIFVVKKIGYGLCCLGIVVAIFLVSKWQWVKHEASRALVTRQCLVVEGPVENYRVMPIEGHPPESFTIGGVRFSYSDYIYTPCFNKTSSHGGPIRAGMSLRIYYRDDCILRIERIQP